MTSYIKSRLQIDSEDIEVVDNFYSWDQLSTVEEPLIKKYLKEENSHEGLWKDTQMPWCISTYKDRKCEVNSFSCDTLLKWKFDFEGEGYKGYYTLQLWH